MATTCTNESGGFVRCQKAGETAEWDTQTFLAHLAARGVPVGVGSAGCGEDDAGPFVRIHLPTGYDPTADVEAFVSPPNEFRQSKSYLRKRRQDIKAKTPAQRIATPANEQDLLALMNLIRSEG